MNIHQMRQTTPPFKSMMNSDCPLCHQTLYFIKCAVKWYKVAKAKSSPHHPRWDFSPHAFTLNPYFVPMHQRPSGHFYQSTPNDTLHHKILALQLYPLIKNVLSTACMHIKNHGGRKEAAHHVQKNLNHYSYLYKSDIFSYYVSIDRPILMKMLSKHVPSKKLVSRIYTALHRDVEMGGNFRPIDGLAMGSSLSPLLGALYLTPLDMAELNEPYWIQPLKTRQKRTDTAFKKSPKNMCSTSLLGGAANSIKKTKNTNAPMHLNGFIKIHQKPKGINFGDFKLKIKKRLCLFKGLGNVFKKDLNGFYDLILDLISHDVAGKKNGIFLNRMKIWMVFKCAGYG